MGPRTDCSSQKRLFYFWQEVSRGGEMEEEGGQSGTAGRPRSREHRQTHRHENGRQAGAASWWRGGG